MVTSGRLIYKNLTDSSILANASNQFISSCASFLDRAYLYAKPSNNWFIVATDGRTAVIIDVGSNQPTGIRMFKSAFQPLPSERSIIIRKYLIAIHVGPPSPPSNIIIAMVTSSGANISWSIPVFTLPIFGTLLKIGHRY